MLAVPASAAPVASDAEIDRILSERIDFYQRGVGMVVGVIGPEGRRVVAHGVQDQRDRRPLTADTEFEVASITKVFVGLLLETMARTGEVKLSEPINALLPPSIQTPLQDGRSITLIDLATHTSGLPEEPGNVDMTSTNPFAAYSEAQFSTAMSGFAYPWKIGSKFRYSNIGYGLLGYGLGERAGGGLPAVVSQRILRPLGMKDTYFALPPALESRLTPGHDADLRPASRWDHSPLFMGSGGMHSTANDLLTFLSAAMNLRPTPLAADFKAMLQVRRAGGISDLFSAIGWNVLERDGQELVYKSGGTGGYTSWIGFDPVAGRGAVVLSNTGDADVSDIGWRLLDSHYPLASLQKQVVVLGTVLDAEAGRYQAPSGEVITITRDADHLAWSIGGGAANMAYPAAKSLFFGKANLVKLAFDFDDEGQTTPRRVVIFRGKGAEVCDRLQ